MRVGLFGGSFNPIHLGHLRAAEEDREALALDLVYFIPAALPPHKPHGGLGSVRNIACKMVRIATRGNRHSHGLGGRSPALRDSPIPIDTVRYFLLHRPMRGTARSPP